MSKYLDEWFEKKPRKITMGVELELLLFDTYTKKPLDNMDICESILSHFRSKKLRRIYRDYYPYQLELRSEAYDNPKDIIDDIRELYTIASEAFLKEGIYVIPIPSISPISDYGFRHCGMHIHIAFPDEEIPNYYNLAMSMYPFILAIADHSKNSEVDDINVSDRLHNSPHIGYPHTNKKDFLAGNSGDRKYRDIILSPPIENPSRTRLEKPFTIEVRMFDTPSTFEFFEFLVNSIFYLASYIKKDSPLIELMEKDFRSVDNRLRLTRKLAVSQRYGVNKIFRRLNSEVCEDMANRFKFNFPSQTQFEFREENGLSASINGFLSMAIKGGWIPDEMDNK